MANRLSRLLVGLFVLAALVAQPGTVAGDGVQPATRPAWASRTFADPGDAKRIVFVCNAGGSMIGKMASLKYELSAAVAGLAPSQSFNLIFLKDESPLVFTKRDLTPATDANKRKADRFLEDVTTSSTSDPIPGLHAAFRQAPDVVYLMTDGDFPDNENVRTEIHRLNRAGLARINTVAFTNDKDSDTEFIAVLKDVAKRNGGSFRHVLESELDYDNLNKPGAKSHIIEEIPAAALSRRDPPQTRRRERKDSDEPIFRQIGDPADVVFVCDGSETMRDKFPRLKAELERAISGLRPGQAFNVIFLREDYPDALSESRLLPANDERKRQAARFLRDARAGGDADLFAGLQAAFELGPKEVVLVGDGWFPAGQEVREAVAALNDGRGVRVHAVCLAGEDEPPESDADPHPLRRVAAANGGTYRRVEIDPPAAEPRGPATRLAWPGRVFADPGDGKRAVFVCDGAGLMLGGMAGLKVELLNAVGALGPDRSFNFVFFESDKIRLLDRKGTVAATDENRRRAERFLGGLTTTIASDPVKGLRAAFRQSPDVVYLLADGNFPDNDAVTGAIGRLNRGRRARVHTVLLVDGWDTDPALVATLREIAKQNGGTFRRVPVARLGG